MNIASTMTTPGYDSADTTFDAGLELAFEVAGQVLQRLVELPVSSADAGCRCSTCGKASGCLAAAPDSVPPLRMSSTMCVMRALQGHVVGLVADDLHRLGDGDAGLHEHGELKCISSFFFTFSLVSSMKAPRSSMPRRRRRATQGGNGSWPGGQWSTLFQTDSSESPLARIAGLRPGVAHLAVPCRGWR